MLLYFSFGGSLRLFLWSLFLLLFCYCRGRTDGSSLRLVFLFGVRSSRFWSGRLFTNVAKINLSQRGILLTRGCSEELFFIALFFFRFLRTLFLFWFFEEFFSLGTHSGVLLKGFYESRILLVVELKARFGLYFAQFALLLKEFNCRLKSYIQFT